jgi:hypothetical protein
VGHHLRRDVVHGDPPAARQVADDGLAFGRLRRDEHLVYRGRGAERLGHALGALDEEPAVLLPQRPLLEPDRSDHPLVVGRGDHGALQRLVRMRGWRKGLRPQP